MFSPDHHIELRVVPNKSSEPEKSKNNESGFLITALMLVIPIVLVLFSASNSRTASSSSTNNGGISESIPSPPSTGHSISNDGAATAPEQTPVQPNLTQSLPSQQRVRIVQCNGAGFDGANFRAYPGLTPSAIQGVVPIGEWVILTGETSRVDGIMWHEVINESALFPSSNPYAQNQLAAQQLGWIATCFVE